ncbi:CopG family transcriptional regulator [Corynebacterium yudongzhengii]|uniref:DUF892 domain-containing protein n=1 Tax=Corynebacterium yudongzhengii TaxID=2080740 RepID=A0A2U1T5A5_9CORY|nr:DUF892 family protein [Corynebacterium yudongzhengii]AWB80939.1 CopG family transcriptional regulator [Corynebacterium yudongzhengii]PWC01135.1 DUF892 domain-containing protein [Corynebacterium yudongzhengii]
MAMTLRLTPEQDHALTLLAAAHGSSKHQAAAYAIVSTAARTLDDARVAALARDTLDEYRRTENRIRQAGQR